MPVNIPKDTDVAWGPSKVTQEAKSGAIPKSGGQVATLMYVQDGDGANFKTKNGNTLACRIEGIDAPETDKTSKGKRAAQPYAEESKKTLKDLLSRGEIRVTVTKGPNDRNFGRNLCKIEVEGKNVTRSMLEAGAAMLWEHGQDANTNQGDRAAQIDAARAGKGIWGLKQPPTDPVRWKHDPIKR